MKTRALTGIFIGALLAAPGPSAAQTLTHLDVRLAALQSNQPVQLEVEVEIGHRGSAPLHWNDTRQRGTAVVVSDRGGAHVAEQQWSGRSTRFSFWRSGRSEADAEPMIDELEAADLVDPAGAVARTLVNATLVSDGPADWQGRPARLLILRPNLGTDPPAGRGEAVPLRAEVRIWLDECGDPLALERSGELRLGPALTVVENQVLTFRLADGRLLVDELRQTSSGTALAVLRGRDDKRLRVVAVQ